MSGACVKKIYGDKGTPVLDAKSWAGVPVLLQVASCLISVLEWLENLIIILLKIVKKGG